MTSTTIHYFETSVRNGFLCTVGNDGETFDLRADLIETVHALPDNNVIVVTVRGGQSIRFVPNEGNDWSDAWMELREELDSVTIRGEVPA